MARTPLPTIALMRLKDAAPTPCGSCFSIECVNRLVDLSYCENCKEGRDDCLLGGETTAERGAKARASLAGSTTRFTSAKTVTFHRILQSVDSQFVFS